MLVNRKWTWNAYRAVLMHVLHLPTFFLFQKIYPKERIYQYLIVLVFSSQYLSQGTQYSSKLWIPLVFLLCIGFRFLTNLDTYIQYVYLYLGNILLERNYTAVFSCMVIEIRQYSDRTKHGKCFWWGWFILD